jgi:hypothetical protein
MDHVPVVVRESARGWETWPDEEVQERGQIYWKTLVSADFTHSGAPYSPECVEGVFSEVRPM